ncbi:MAG TPA: hypothetical protein VL860_12740, partial [Planctomycetota bacterium]|nr:hypothetical protein [Planctomycetota bacterium]
ELVPLLHTSQNRSKPAVLPIRKQTNFALLVLKGNARFCENLPNHAPIRTLFKKFKPKQNRRGRPALRTPSTRLIAYFPIREK